MIGIEERPDTIAEIALELRVFGGRLDGARQRLEPRARLRVGHGFDNDLVLRGRDTAGIALTLRLEDGRALVEVISGAPVLLGCPLQPGASAVLPFFVPLALGEYALSIGEADAPRWAEVAALLAAPPVMSSETAPAAVTDAPVSAAANWLQQESRAALGRLPLTQRPGLFILAAVVLLIAVLAAPAYRLVEREVNTPAAVARNLAAAGWPGLEVRRDTVGSQLVIEGRVADDRAVARLKAHVDRHYRRVAVRVTTLAGVAQAVDELLQSQGIDAEARPGRGAVIVRSEYLPSDRLVTLRARIRADLPGVGPVRFVRDLNRGPRDLQYFFASKRFGLASLIDGDPGHIVTQDGQFWFAGALLPTGHRLLAVRNGSITFQRDGLTETLRVATSSPTPPPPPVTSTPAGLVAPATTRS